MQENRDWRLHKIKRHIKEHNINEYEVSKKYIRNWINCLRYYKNNMLDIKEGDIRFYVNNL